MTAIDSSQHALWPTGARWGAVMAIVVAFSARSAAACGACVLGIGEYYLPGIFGWFWWGIVWFVAMSAARSSIACSVPGIPRPWFALAAATGAFLAGGVFLGFLPVIPLAVGSVVATVWAFLPASAGIPGRRVLQFVGALGFAVGLGLAGYSLYVRIGQTDVDYVCRWPSGPMTRSIEKRWEADEPRTATIYREVVRRSSAGAAVDAAKRLGEIGDPLVDVALLEDLLTRMPEGMSWGREPVGDAIYRLKSRMPSS